MKTTTLITSAILCALLALASPSAQAQDDATETRARQLLAQAQAHYDGGRKALAAQTYLELYELLREAGHPRAPIALWNAGNTLTDVPGRERDAIETLRRFLDESTALTDDQDVRDWRSEAVSLIDELEARVGPEPHGAATEQLSEPAEDARVAEPPDDMSGEEGGGGISPIGPIVLGVGIATAAVGGVLGALALVRDGELAGRCAERTCLDTPENRATNHEMRTLSIAADAMLVAGGLIAIGGIALVLVLNDGGSAPETNATATLRVGPGQLEVWGTF
jgi:hypothetical protein